MDIMNEKKLLSGVTRLHDKARATNKMRVKLNNKDYYISFNGSGFEVEDNNNEYICCYNTRKITQARKWFKAEYSE